MLLGGLRLLVLRGALLIGLFVGLGCADTGGDIAQPTLDDVSLSERAGEMVKVWVAEGSPGGGECAELLPYMTGPADAGAHPSACRVAGANWDFYRFSASRDGALFLTRVGVNVLYADPARVAGSEGVPAAVHPLCRDHLNSILTTMPPTDGSVVSKCWVEVSVRSAGPEEIDVIEVWTQIPEQLRDRPAARLMYCDDMSRFRTRPRIDDVSLGGCQLRTLSHPGAR